MKNSIFILGIFLLCGCSPIKKLYNNFSDFKEIKKFSDSNTPVRIYFDRFGDIYPEIPVVAAEFENKQSILENYFTGDEIRLRKAFEKEGLKYPENESIKLKFKKLQEYLHSKYVTEINTLSTGKKLVFLIHGYNNTGESASVVMEKLRVGILKKFPQQTFQFVEVYWDGLTMRNKSLNSFKIWDNAQYSSAMAGLGLRRILNSIQKDESYVITHSHGAAVITEALFNVRRFDNEFYDKNDNGLEIKMLQAEFDTPKTKFTVGMLTPAIPGSNVFEEYYNRTTDGKTQVTETSNYRFINGFNRYDIATTKGVFSRYVGATTLSCNDKEHKAVAQIFNNNESIYLRTDFSANPDKKQRSHSVANYIQNPSFDSFLNSVFK